MSKNLVFLTLIIVLFAPGCSSPESPTISVSQGAPTPSIIPSLTPPPPTPTSLPPVGVFLASREADQGVVGELKPVVASSTKEEGDRFQSLEKMSVEDLNEETYRFVVALSPQPNIDALVQAAPETDFLAVGFSDLEPSRNLSVVPSGQENVDRQGFMAGYIAAMITPDWRVGVLGLRDSPSARQAREAFSLGVRYFCGLCLPDHPPYEYPLYVELNAGASSTEWRSSANVLVKKGVKTFYVVPGAGDEELLRFLVEADAQILADGRSYTEDLQDGWVASLKFDLMDAVLGYWPEFLSGDVGHEVRVPLVINDVNEELLSPGRLRNAESVLEQVREGWIKTTVE